MLPIKLKLRYFTYALALTCFTFVAIKLYLQYKLETQIVTSYQGISLGDTKDQVVSALGVPAQVLFPPRKQDLILENKSIIRDVEISTVAIKKEIDANPKKEKGFDYWEYERGGYRLFINFNPGTDKVNLIGCYVFDHTKIDSNTCAVGEIKALDSEEYVLDKLGNPDTSETTGIVKIISYSKLNLVISFEKSSVFHIQVKKTTDN